MNLYIDTIEGFSFQGSYPVGDTIRYAYAAPLPRLALVFLDDKELWQCVGQYFDASVGWANRRGADEWRCSFGHIPGALQTKIQIRRCIKPMVYYQTLSQIIFQAPVYNANIEIAA